jgi:3-phosphoshikimate 1-carboxyvinyltransferase
MALAFAPYALKSGEIIINNPLVVTKSYPHFWEDLAEAGFTIEVRE